jgi:Tfp pilus assembly protein PilF
MPKTAPILLLLAALVGTGCRGQDSPADVGDDQGAPVATHGTPLGNPLAIAQGAHPPSNPAPLSPELSQYFRLIQDRHPGARVRLRKYVDNNPQDGRARFLFGLSYHQEKRYGLARPWYEQAISLAPEYGQTYHFYGWCLYYLGDPDLARRALQIHLRFDPEEPDSHFALGLIALDADELEEAQQYFRRAIELCQGQDDRTRDLAKARVRLADTLVRNGDFQDARIELEQAAVLEPELYETHYKLFRVLSYLGEDEAATQAQARFLAAREKVYPMTSFPE